MSVILVADLGKFNSILCWFEPGSRHRSATELTRQPATQVVFEACSQAGWVHDLREELKLPAFIASTTGAAWHAVEH